VYKYQFGFRANHSTSLALLKVTDIIYEQLDAGSTVCSVYLDLQKAFDSLIHDVLLKELNVSGIREALFMTGLKVSCVTDFSSLV
jgi:hypothetical protein